MQAERISRENKPGPQPGETIDFIYSKIDKKSPIFYLKEFFENFVRKNKIILNNKTGHK